ncbi:TlyA family RNA methyltransferase [Hyphomicrobium sp.]|uniref:TlyA family RNA methyltransferase n=1 Tax=Hyphomicrobium sp. TaxID=82 RepID=UPI0039C88653
MGTTEFIFNDGKVANLMRLDQTLVARGLAPSRARAQDLIRRGFVRVGGRTCDKLARDVPDDALIEISSEAPGYVSRGAEKLTAALDRFALDPAGVVALDVGASTGGFTEVLLERRAERVYAVDVGTAQLHPRLRNDPRVVSLENCDGRALTREIVPVPVGAIVIDVSFISVTKVLGHVLPLAAHGAWLVVLVKPQFEVGRERIGGGGIVRDDAARRDALQSVRAWLESQSGWRVVGDMVSPIAGGSGNAEYLVGALRDV